MRNNTGIGRETLKDRIMAGFTLAEVLIAIAIVGVIAALVIPKLAITFQDRALEQRFNRERKAIENTISNLLITEGQDSYEKTMLYTNPAEGAAIDYEKTSGKFLKKYFKYKEYYDSSTTAQSKNRLAKVYTDVDGSTYDTTKINGPCISKRNGATICIAPQVGEEGAVTVYIDINGKNGPNVFTRDLREYTIRLPKKGELISGGNDINSVETPSKTCEATNPDYDASVCCKEGSTSVNWVKDKCCASDKWKDDEVCKPKSDNPCVTLRDKMRSQDSTLNFKDYSEDKASVVYQYLANTLFKGENFNDLKNTVEDLNPTENWSGLINGDLVNNLGKICNRCTNKTAGEGGDITGFDRYLIADFCCAAGHEFTGDVSEFLNGPDVVGGSSGSGSVFGCVNNNRFLSASEYREDWASAEEQSWGMGPEEAAKIRAMTDEQLKEYIKQGVNLFHSCETIEKCDIDGKNCKDVWLDWDSIYDGKLYTDAYYSCSSSDWVNCIYENYYAVKAANSCKRVIPEMFVGCQYTNDNSYECKATDSIPINYSAEFYDPSGIESYSENDDLEPKPNLFEHKYSPNKSDSVDIFCDSYKGSDKQEDINNWQAEFGQYVLYNPIAPGAAPYYGCSSVVYTKGNRVTGGKGYPGMKKFTLKNIINNFSLSNNKKNNKTLYIQLSDISYPSPPKLQEIVFKASPYDDNSPMHSANVHAFTSLTTGDWTSTYIHDPMISSRDKADSLFNGMWYHFIYQDSTNYGGLYLQQNTAGNSIWNNCYGQAISKCRGSLYDKDKAPVFTLTGFSLLGDYNNYKESPLWIEYADTDSRVPMDPNDDKSVRYLIHFLNVEYTIPSLP